jgi:AcrR family transcriptional regulator
MNCGSLLRVPYRPTERTEARRNATRAAGETAGPCAVDRLAAAVEAFARRALRGRRLAWALLAEPVDPAVEAERLVFRRAYAAVFDEIVSDGVAAGELPPQNVGLTAAALVGALGEALVGPLSPVAADVDPDALVADLVAFSLRSVTGLVG